MVLDYCNWSCSYLISILVDIQGHLKVNKGKKKTSCIVISIYMKYECLWLQQRNIESKYIY